MNALARIMVFSLLFGCQPQAAYYRLANLLQPERRWLKAALHTHTVHSDGENTPQEMLRWYRRNGFDVVALTDHNRNMPLTVLSENLSGLVVLPGVEFTSRGAERPVHVNGLFTLLDVSGARSNTPRAALEHMLRILGERRALAVINHPNYERALAYEDVRGLDFGLIEIYNASSSTLNDGAADLPSVEALWDRLLLDDRRIYGIATDDAHALPGGENPNIPGRGWTMLYARPDPADIRLALETGRSYASTGPELSAFTLTKQGLHVRAKALTGLRYVWVITDGLRRRVESGPEIALARPANGYLRAKLLVSDGSRLYLQPLFAADHKKTGDPALRIPASF